MRSLQNARIAPIQYRTPEFFSVEKSKPERTNRMHPTAATATAAAIAMVATTPINVKNKIQINFESTGCLCFWRMTA